LDKRLTVSIRANKARLLTELLDETDIIGQLRTSYCKDFERSLPADIDERELIHAKLTVLRDMERELRILGNKAES
jgi:hypothetical protein